MEQFMNILQEQLENPKYKQDAEDCIEVYNWLSATDNGCVMQRKWYPLIDIVFKGVYPNKEKICKLNLTGSTLLKGIKVIELINK